MMTKELFPTFDGETIDIGQSIAPLVDGNQNIVLHEHFNGGSLAWWLDPIEGPQGGPYEKTGVSIDGIGPAGHHTDAVIQPAAEASFLQTLRGPTIQLQHWSEIRCFAYGVKVSDPSCRAHVLLSDDPHEDELETGQRCVTSPDGRYYNRWNEEGVEKNSHSIPLDPTDRRMYGFHLYNHPRNEEADGHTIQLYCDNKPHDNWPVEDDSSSQSTDLTFYFGAISDDGGTYTCRFDGIYVELVPMPDRDNYDTSHV